MAQVLGLIEDQRRELAGLAEAQDLAADRLAVRGAAARRFQPECPAERLVDVQDGFGG